MNKHFTRFYGSSVLIYLLLMMFGCYNQINTVTSLVCGSVITFYMYRKERKNK